MDNESVRFCERLATGRYAVEVSGFTHVTQPREESMPKVLILTGG
jgi:hypothetical protein